MPRRPARSTNSSSRAQYGFLFASHRVEIMAFLPPNPAPPPGWGGQLTIETPEQTSLEFAVAGIGSRFLALALDTLIQIAIGTIVIFAAALLFRALPGSLSLARIWIGATALVLFFL